MLVVGAQAQPAVAREVRAFDIPAGKLSDAIVMLGVQGGISVGFSDPQVQARRSPAVRGRLTISEALYRLLKGSGFHFVAIDERTFSIAANPVAPVRPIAPAITPLAVLPTEIIVTASKRDTLLQDFPGTVTILDVRAAGLDGTGRNATQAIVNAVPALASTQLGPGRNKLIIRGIADSSFTGPTQAIVGQYLGDTRLNYNAPDPDLNLYDMRSVEVLEGPQGTLYGAGSLGGIVRLIPNAPDLTKAAGSMAAGIGFAQQGDMSTDIGAMVNVPIRRDVVAVRAVAYRSVEGGYIDDAYRGLNNINRSKTQGARIDVRIDAGDGWKIDVGGYRAGYQQCRRAICRTHSAALHATQRHRPAVRQRLPPRPTGRFEKMGRSVAALGNRHRPARRHRDVRRDRVAARPRPDIRSAEPHHALLQRNPPFAPTPRRHRLADRYDLHRQRRKRDPRSRQPCRAGADRGGAQCRHPGRGLRRTGHADRIVADDHRGRTAGL